MVPLNKARCRQAAWSALLGVMMALAPWHGEAQCQENTNLAAAAPESADAAFRAWLDTLRNDARAKGISNATLDTALRGITPVKRIIELDRHQPEFTQTFWSYLNKRVNQRRIDIGRTLLLKHQRLLTDIHARYGVPPRYLVSFWGLETNFGTYTGGFHVIDALVTLAYDRRRANFFYTQLLGALQIIEDGHISPNAMTGSWAGAMGQMQFMPSTFIAHAVDYSGDGRKDIWQSLPDAFASAANYLSDMGWRSREIWGREVKLPSDIDLSLATMNTKKTLTTWSALGVRRADGRELPRADMQGAIVLPQGRKGPAFLVYDNFQVILRWNRSIHYAIAVGHLADRIVGRPAVINGRKAEHSPLSREDIKNLQGHLNRLGFDAGSPDGLPGPRTKAALRAFQKKHALPPDGYPSPSLLRFLQDLNAQD